ncbi:MAG TPA: hypothetical protein VKH46_04840 [Thermoanaerobaculia bacterium]|nr:hypothetical protein [Thermoanaerobaculia bacterium]
MRGGEDAHDASGSPLDERRAITVRLPNETLAALQFVSATIRRSSGAALGSSAIVRALITRLSEVDIDTRRVRTLEDLRSILSVRLVPSAGRAGETRVHG